MPLIVSENKLKDNKNTLYKLKIVASPVKIYLSR